MATFNTKTHYGWVSKSFHWVVAIFMIGLLIFGFCLDYFDKPLRFDMINLHKSTGLLLLGIMCLRLLWTLLNEKPLLPESMRVFDKNLAHLIHSLLYLFAIVMPLDGWIMSSAGKHHPNFYGLFDATLPIGVNPALSSVGWLGHQIFAWTLVVLISLHALAGLLHHFIGKNDILKRML